MNKGTKKYAVRIPDDMLDEIMDVISSANKTRKGEPYTLSSWLRDAVLYKLAALERGRGSQATRRTISVKPALTLDGE